MVAGARRVDTAAAEASQRAAAAALLLAPNGSVAVVGHPIISAQGPKYDPDTADESNTARSVGSAPDADDCINHIKLPNAC